MRKVLGIAILAGALGAVPALAQSTPDQTKPQPKPKSTTSTSHKPAGQSQPGQKTAGTTGTLAPADHNFVNEAAIGGMAEVELGNLAKEKASNPDVKSFGDRMATDHGKANDELKNWAQQKNVTLPTELDARHKAERDRLAKLSGEAFDKAYMRLMVADHNHDVAAFKRESTAAKDPDLKAWAGKTLPTLQDHMKMAKDTNAKVAGTGGTAPAKKTTTPKKSPGK
jgi:putative membrane protein